MHVHVGYWLHMELHYYYFILLIKGIAVWASSTSGAGNQLLQGLLLSIIEGSVTSGNPVHS